MTYKVSGHEGLDGCIPGTDAASESPRFQKRGASASLSADLGTLGSDLSEIRPSIPQDEIDVDGGVHFDWLAVEFVGLVAGAGDGFQCGMGEHGWAADDVRLFYESLFGDDGFDHDCSLNAGLFRDDRVDGLDGSEQASSCDSGRYANRACRLDARRRGRKRRQRA